jgi:D-3-phosphoglycerate dehydrogenase
MSTRSGPKTGFHSLPLTLSIKIEKPVTANFPEVSLPEHPGKQRLLHIHRNQPGVLASINAVFSTRRINVSGEYLQTNSRIGYVVVDIELADPGEILQIRRGLEKIPGTIRTRLLY